MAVRHREDRHPHVPKRLVTRPVNAGLSLAPVLAKRGQSQYGTEQLAFPPPPFQPPRGAEGVRPPAEAGSRDLLFTSSQLLGPLLPSPSLNNTNGGGRDPRTPQTCGPGEDGSGGTPALCLRRLPLPRRSSRCALRGRLERYPTCLLPQAGLTTAPPPRVRDSLQNGWVSRGVGGRGLGRRRLGVGWA